MTRSGILVAGIGNIFLGDDGFGVEVVRRLAARPLPPDVRGDVNVDVRIKDFGIRGFDLAFALDTAEIVILVDAVSRGEAPGTIYTIEPDVDNLQGSGASDARTPDAHSMDPIEVLRLAKQMNIEPGRILLVGCEPATFGPEGEGQMGLSPPVEGAVDRAVELIESMIAAWRESGQESLAGEIQAR
jgi:hydrogenase maturation protease